MNTPSPDSLHARLHRTGVIAVLVIDDAADAVPVARALQAGGVDSIELTLRTDAAMESLRRIRGELPEMLAGVGTILTPKQVNDVKAAGAAFGVAPGMNPRVVSEAARIGLPFSPGVCTPTDIELAVEQGCRLLKFFPSEPSGGLAYLRAVAAPFAHLGVKYIPLGGVGAGNAEDYLREPHVLALGGSWLGPRDAIKQKDWSAITRLASAATAIVNRVRGGAA
ncbi:MAG: bifunctional 4-hydroxy-2-oxoglutarate aldolase/2-dehydro-3-deoxy-phosphogluconate aldolase [Verrucomicrobiaceae bacterium]|nr:bifunctional 4-hydroxy-2-oxoglutarate aldolase/2-dehydro-3-deoxy-phosphogluconate aldolase [Verrucomicrobiaceae bacterium]